MNLGLGATPRSIYPRTPATMPSDVPRNANISKLAAGYLFPTIGRVSALRFSSSLAPLTTRGKDELGALPGLAFDLRSGPSRSRLTCLQRPRCRALLAVCSFVHNIPDLSQQPPTSLTSPQRVRHALHRDCHRV
jgi:hypothetical protein